MVLSFAMVAGVCVRAERVELFATTDFMWSAGSARILPASSWLPSLRLWRLRDGPRHAVDIPIMAGLEKNGATRRARPRNKKGMQSADGQTISKMGVYRKSGVVQAFHLRSFGVEFFAWAMFCRRSIPSLFWTASEGGRLLLRLCMPLHRPREDIDTTLTHWSD